MVDEEKGKPLSVWFSEEDKPLLEKLEKACEHDKGRPMSAMIKIILEENVDKYLKR
jgi:hypothetical protein